MTHVADESGQPSLESSHEYVELMVYGPKHWGLPARWVTGLQDHLNEGV